MDFVFTQLSPTIVLKPCGIAMGQNKDDTMVLNEWDIFQTLIFKKLLDINKFETTMEAMNYPTPPMTPPPLTDTLLPLPQPECYRADLAATFPYENPITLTPDWDQLDDILY